MAPTDRIRLPFRWQFVPVRDPQDGSVRWVWRAHTQGGELAMQAQRVFETLTECMADAKAHGYSA